MGVMNRYDESKKLVPAREFRNESKSEGWKIVVVTNDFSLDLVLVLRCFERRVYARFVPVRVFVSTF